MPFGDALVDLERKIYSSLEADEIFKKHAKAMSEYNRNIKNQKTDESNYHISISISVTFSISDSISITTTIIINENFYNL